VNWCLTFGQGDGDGAGDYQLGAEDDAADDLFDGTKKNSAQNDDGRLQRCGGGVTMTTGGR
jgi:hypothetical protein